MNIQDGVELKNDEFTMYYNEIRNTLRNKLEDIDFKNLINEKLKELENDNYLKSNYILAIISFYYDTHGFVEITNEDISKIIFLDRAGLISLDADDNILLKREIELKKFFDKVRVKKGIKSRVIKLDFQKGDYLYSVYNNKYIIALVLEENIYSKEILLAMFYKNSLCKVEELLDESPIVVGWIDGTFCKLIRSKSGKAFANYQNMIRSVESIKKYEHFNINKDNSNCAQGIFVNHYYFISDALVKAKEFSQYNGYEIRFDADMNIEILKEKSCWGWKHISRPDNVRLKDYIE